LIEGVLIGFLLIKLIFIIIIKLEVGIYLRG